MARASNLDVVDAEFETVAHADGQPYTVKPAVGSIVSTSAPVTGMEMLRRSQASAPGALASRGGPMFWAFGLGLAAAAFWVSGGHAIVRNATFVAAQAPQHALRISGVTSRVDSKGTNPLLFVDGEVANDGSALSDLPALRIAVAGNDGRITHYSLGTSGRSLTPGETFAFSSRLDMPKNGVKTVSVTFGE